VVLGLRLVAALENFVRVVASNTTLPSQLVRNASRFRMAGITERQKFDISK
jgi:hypothetical protein